MAVLGSDPTLSLCEDEDGSSVWICMYNFGKGLGNKQCHNFTHQKL